MKALAASEIPRLETGSFDFTDLLEEANTYVIPLNGMKALAASEMSRMKINS